MFKTDRLLKYGFHLFYLLEQDTSGLHNASKIVGGVLKFKNVGGVLKSVSNTDDKLGSTGHLSEKSMPVCPLIPPGN